MQQLVTAKTIDELCPQEADTDVNFDHSLLSFPGYKYELEISNKHTGT
jgi:hypothetical protein